MIRSIILFLSAALLCACDSNNSPSDSSPIQASLHTLAIPEGAEGTTSVLAMPITINAPSTSELRFRFSTEADSAQPEQEYISTTGEVSIPAGEISTTIPITIIGDNIEEASQRFLVRIESDDVELHRSEAYGYIANDDSTCEAPAPGAANRWLAEDRLKLNYAHRGGVIDFPENTLYAYKKVAEAGADVLEMDVYETADGELVILHDLDVDRTTNGTGLVGELTLAELKQLDAAHWFVTGRGTPHDAAESDYSFRGIALGEKAPPPGYRAEDFRIPTLEQALQAFPDRLINVELKPDLDGIGNYETQVAELLRRYGRFDDVIVASFVDEAMSDFKSVAPCFPTSVPLGQAQQLILASFGDNPMAPAPEHVALQVPPDTSQIQQIDALIQIVSPDLIEDAHNAGLALHVWTINECEEMIEMLELGVDAVMTDRPLLLEKVLAQPADQRSCEGLE